MQNVNLKDQIDDITLYMTESKLVMADEINHLSDELNYYK